MSGPNNPLAFPNTGNSTWGMSPEVGMTLRDWFAGQALTSIAWMHSNGDHEIGGSIDVADMAYSLADAMLTARTQSKDTPQ